MEGYMCDFWLPGGNAVKRQRVYNPTFTSSEAMNPAEQHFSPLYNQLQVMAMENALLKEKVSNLEKKLAACVKGKAFNRGKAFSSLSPSRKRHRKQEIRDFLFSVSKRLPPDWVLEEVYVHHWHCVLFIMVLDIKGS